MHDIDEASGLLAYRHILKLVDQNAVSDYFQSDIIKLVDTAYGPSSLKECRELAMALFSHNDDAIVRLTQTLPQLDIVSRTKLEHALGSRLSIPKETQDMLLGSENELTRAMIAAHRDTMGKRLDKILSNYSSLVKSAALTNPNLSQARFASETLSKDALGVAATNHVNTGKRKTGR